MFDDFAPTASCDNLRLRARLLARLRRFFEAAGFLEVETPLLSADVVVDRHLDPFSTILAPDPRRPDEGLRLWLQTSPEAAMKRLLAAGAGPIYQVTRSFRNGERGPRHNPEFTIVEWYRPGDDMQSGIRLLGELSQALLNRGPARAIRYADAFRQHLGIDPHEAGVEMLAEAARRHAVAIPPGFETADRDSWLDLLLSMGVQPQLGRDQPEILYDFPASQAALALVRHEQPPVAERFELFVAGVELANGYHELLDADVLQGRTDEQNALRQAEGKPPLPGPARLLAAMRHGLPGCTGAALGFDRLVMLAAGASQIDEVIAFPIERA